MAATLDTTGIHNEGEFYSHHYLTALLEDDLKDLFKKWKADEEHPEPWREVRRLAKPLSETLFRLEKQRDPEARLKTQRAFARQLLEALGYEYQLRIHTTDACPITLLAEINTPSGAPLLWILESFDPSGEDQDPLELTIHPIQIGSEPCEADLSKVISSQVFFRAEPPRWVLVVSHKQVILLDRSKWAARKTLRFDLEEILSRGETSTLRATAALLHRDSLCPDDGMPLLDTLDENSHKHAFDVSEDLKYALREAVEMLGNEAIYYKRTVKKERIYETDLAGPLTEECLRYMYRLLFLFYIEARPELGYAPLNAASYREGYSLEKLRDLENVPLETERALDGYFIHDSLKQLFRLVFEGYSPALQGELHDPGEQTFAIPPLKSHLFDPERTSILEGVKLRNRVLQHIIRTMSLSETGKRTGRISYAQLGINQLGAVYEALLSYRGFFAETDLYEVKKAGDKDDKKRQLEQAYFVTADQIEDYSQKERVFNKDGTLLVHPKGTFIYRLAGRDREKSASYYTPEVLTRCLVKYALKELLPGKSADDILDITICEPAMGSAAFLNEAISQLSDAYLELKQKERGEALAPEEYQREKQRVKMYLADNNVFGVDLNPVAVELAEVSIWLNTLVEGGFVPWFGNQLKCGNSLVGARSQVFTATQVRHGSGKDSWLKSVPSDVALGTKRPGGSVYHFLLPDEGMAAYSNKVIKGLMPEQLDLMKAWRKTFCAKLTQGEISRLERLSDSIERLWERHVSELRRIEQATTDAFGIYGHPAAKDAPRPTSTRAKDEILDQQLYSKAVRNSSPYRRLKLVMDYWCALWYWPIERAGELPSRNEYLTDLEALVAGKERLSSIHEGEQAALFPSTLPKQLALEMRDQLGFVDIDALIQGNPRLQIVEELSGRYRFHHWHLEFADLFADRGGFDLILGNPPWIKLSWSESGIMGDADPRFVVKKFSAPQIAKLRNEALEDKDLLSSYLKEYEEADATTTFLNASQNYPLLKGSQTNLFKCFLPVAWSVSSKSGVTGMLHPEGVYDDPKGGALRRELYQQLRGHYQFWNELYLFPEVHHQTLFSINIYGPQGEPHFDTIANLYSPPTVDACYAHDGLGAVPGIKTDQGSWNLSGHRDRIVSIGAEELQTFAKLYDKPGTPSSEARLPAVHSKQIVDVLERFAEAPQKLGDLSDQYMSLEMWHETNAQNDGTIKRETRFATSPNEWILSGPHFFVGNPFYKTPNEGCSHNQDYSVLDLTTLPEDYLPRTNYVPACSEAEYRARTPKVPWGDRKPVTEFFKVTSRTMIGSSSERTLISCITPPKRAHIDLGFSIVLQEQGLTPFLCGLFHSVPFDLFVKTTGKGHFRNDIASLLPFAPQEPEHQYSSAISLRTLLLNAVTVEYAPLWRTCWRNCFAKNEWSTSNVSLDPHHFRRLDPQWSPTTPVRNDFARRQLLVEIDVLSAMLLKLELEQLQTAFRVQFPVLNQYESDTWYDRHGRIVFTPSRGLTGVGLPRTKRSGDPNSYGIHTSHRAESGILLGWEDVKDLEEGFVTKTFMDDTLPGGPVERTVEYHAPFTKCDREEDYRVAWAHFEKLLAEENA